MCAWACSGVWARGGGVTVRHEKSWQLRPVCPQFIAKANPTPASKLSWQENPDYNAWRFTAVLCRSKCVSGQTCLFSDTIRPSEHSRDEQRLSWLSWLQGCQRHRVAAAVAGSPRVSTSNFARSPIAYKWISSRGFQENSRKQVP